MKYYAQARRNFEAKLIAEGRVPGGPQSKAELVRLGLGAKERDHDGGPRNAAAHALIAQEFPGFEAEVVELPEGRQTVRFSNYPLIGGKNPSLADLARQALVRR